MPGKNRIGVIVSDWLAEVRAHDIPSEDIGTFGCCPSEFQTAANWLSNRDIDVSPLIEDRMPLKKLQQAFEKASTPDNFRVAVMIE